jgi:protein required for attachment to host cells
MKPDWTLVANGTRARLLQQAPGAPMVILESFIHPPSADDGGAASPSPLRDLDANWSAGRHTPFARELTHLLEQEARLEHYRSITIFASMPLLDELEGELGTATRRRLVGLHAADLTHSTLSEIEERIADAFAADH